MERTYGLKVATELPDTPAPTDPARALAVYRMAQEALHNVVKHAGATVVIIRIIIGENKLTIEIADNGRGMLPPDAVPLGNGLTNMRSRAAAIRALCEWLPAASGSGTVVRLTLALAPQS